MSRVAKRPVALPQGVTATITPNLVTIKGAKGSLSVAVSNGVSVKEENKQLQVSYNAEGEGAAALAGVQGQGRQVFGREDCLEGRQEEVARGDASMTISSKDRRVRRAVKTRHHIRQLGVARLTIHRTPRHIYAQVFDAEGAKVLAAASTVQESVAKGLEGTGNVEAAKAVGISKVAFDRAGFRFHGRVKALADAAREAGLEF